MPIGKILGFYGGWSSGLAELVLEVKGKLVTVHCDNGSTVRALDAIFGDVIVPSHSVDSLRIKGKRIIFSVDELGILSSIGPVPEKGAK